jgi:hypothetical protein
LDVRRLRFATWGLLAAITVQAGCAHLEHDIDAGIAADTLVDIAHGSHYGAVLERFGPPTKLTTLPDGMAFLYEHVYLQERQYGLILPGEIGKWIKAVYASADADVDVLLFVFDKDGRLQGADAQSWSADAGAGMSMTLIFSAGSFTDTENYESSPAELLDWGKALTQPLLVSLNTRQSLKSGENGLEQTTSADGIGQHTLELKTE